MDWSTFEPVTARILDQSPVRLMGRPPGEGRTSPCASSWALTCTYPTVDDERSADNLHLAAEAGSTGQSLVAGDEDCVQQFCKGYVRGVVRR